MATNGASADPAASAGAEGDNLPEIELIIKASTIDGNSNQKENELQLWACHKGSTETEAHATSSGKWACLYLYPRIFLLTR